MIRRRTYSNECWWCGSRAGTREHRYKKSDVVREFGRGPYRGQNAVLRGVSGRLLDVQGPDSIQFKFGGHVCEQCNTARSQPFDTAYDAFTAFVRNNEALILSRATFRWSDIYGTEWKKGCANVLRYFVKHISCRIADNGLEVGKPLIEFLDGSSDDPVWVRCEMEIRVDIARMIEELERVGSDSGYLALGDLVVMQERFSGQFTSIISFLGYRWLRVNYIYDPSHGPCKSNISSNVVQLPRAWSVDPRRMQLGH